MQFVPRRDSYICNYLLFLDANLRATLQTTSPRQWIRLLGVGLAEKRISITVFDAYFDDALSRVAKLIDERRHMTE
ncbi:hypothetical protein BN2476_470141 [Paraburkholderia piptadeniae]|uniref:Uncharacterized protein n=1 Tax=Paraburkholderia piptadeniae TaxID=1701573 RepID=A0A1N7SE87_9BURK|nr:hypothetical protein BN2476_470141 [Paraburkholderia piptadeniae]